ncbi:MAG TPA: hypothetical protein VIH42_13860 [Thermoguttaceae bacterium]
MYKTRAMLVVLLAVLAFGRIATAFGAEQSRFDAEKMKAALRTTTAEEDGFIDYVLTKVSKGILPPDLVDSTFQWARKKPAKHRFQYFKQALIVRAENIGIKL